MKAQKFAEEEAKAAAAAAEAAPAPASRARACRRGGGTGAGRGGSGAGCGAGRPPTTLLTVSTVVGKAGVSADNAILLSGSHLQGRSVGDRGAARRAVCCAGGRQGARGGAELVAARV